MTISNNYSADKLIMTANVFSRTMDYDIDPLRQAIADSWPNSLDDSIARREWGWNPRYDLDSMVEDMFENLQRKLCAERDR